MKWLNKSGGVAFETESLPDIRYRLSSLTINGHPVSGMAAHFIASAMLDMGAIKAMRRLYGHHLPRRLRRGKK